MAHPTYKYVKLSSKYTNLSVFGMIAMVLISPILILAMWGADSSVVLKLLLILFVVAIIALGVFVTLKMAHAEIKDNKFYVRKVIGRQEIYELEDLKSVKSYHTGRETYITFTLEKAGKSEMYLVYASHLFYLAEKRNAEEILRQILADNQKS